MKNRYLLPLIVLLILNLAVPVNMVANGSNSDQSIQQLDSTTYLIAAPSGTADFLTLNLTDGPERQCVVKMVTKALEVVRDNRNADFQLTIDGSASSLRMTIMLFPAAPLVAPTVCDFCQRAFKGAIIAEDEHTIAFEKSTPPRNPINFLIIPKTHVANYKDPQCTADIFVNQLAMAQKMASNLKDPHSIKLQVNNGSNAAQSVFHSHMHFTSNSSWK